MQLKKNHFDSLQVMNKIKTTIGSLLLPFVRIYVRYFPFQRGKASLLRGFWGRQKLVTVKTIFGARMEVNTKDLIDRCIYFFGRWESNLTCFVESRLKGLSGRCFVDVGANVGYFSLLASSAFRSGKVVAIEAYLPIYKKLLGNIEMNQIRNVRPVNVAAVNVARPVEMFYGGESNEGRTSIVSTNRERQAIKVDGLPLSDILDDAEISSVRLIKIDVEGAEYLVFKGMVPLLEMLPDDCEIIMEISSDVLEKNELDEIFETFSKHGYEPYRITNSYSLEAYIYSTPQRTLPRLRGLPGGQTDVVFSKVNADFLESF